jgi:hypothetical protein
MIRTCARPLRWQPDEILRFLLDGRGLTCGCWRSVPPVSSRAWLYVALGSMPESPVRDRLTAMFDDYTTHGFHGGNNLVLSAILGRAPRSLGDYFAELDIL